MRTGFADLPLHYGKAPSWLFQRMTELARQITIAVVSESGPGEMLRRLSNPHWFQAFGCVLGFDWHSSGLTTTVCGALKEGLKGIEPELGLFVAGGKGRTSRQTPQQIETKAGSIGLDPSPLVYASRMSAKVDSAALQDGYQIYHHVLVFTPNGKWAVIQQGMNETLRYARRYHWLGDNVTTFVSEPHAAVCCDKTGAPLNMVAAESEAARLTTSGLAREKPELLIGELARLESLRLGAGHSVDVSNIDPKRLRRIFLSTYERQPSDFEQLLGMRGVGPRTIRALSLISELVYGARPSFRDPVTYSFAHGGKDGHPYPVDRETYDKSIEVLRTALSQAKIGRSEKLAAFRRLGALAGPHR